MKKASILVLILAVLGVIISSYSLYLHNQDSSTFCNISATFNCDIVNKGIYSEIANIPVALFGIIGYEVLGIGSLLMHRKKIWFQLTAIAAAIGFTFALYLTSIEVFTLKTYCLICLSSQAVILVIVIILLYYYRRHIRAGLPA